MGGEEYFGNIGFDAGHHTGGAVVVNARCWRRNSLLIIPNTHSFHHGMKPPTRSSNLMPLALKNPSMDPKSQFGQLPWQFLQLTAIAAYPPIQTPVRIPITWMDDGDTQRLTREDQGIFDERSPSLPTRYRSSATRPGSCTSQILRFISGENLDSILFSTI